MIPPDDLLENHKRKYSFYYELAEEFEVTAMNTICWLNLCVTLAVHPNRNHLDPDVLEALDQLTNVVEIDFMEVCGMIRDGQAYRSLTDERREAMEEGCLRIKFETDDFNP